MLDFYKLPNGTVINLQQIIKLRDITGNGFYRIYLSDGTTEEAGEAEAKRIEDKLLTPPPWLLDSAFATPEKDATEERAEKPEHKKRGRPPGSKNKASAATKT